MNNPYSAKTTKSVFLSFAKAISILSIVIFHYNQYMDTNSLIQKFNPAFGAGIYVFFFASGYGLSNSKSLTVIQFYSRRLIKVLIPYFIGISVIFLINALLHIYKDGFVQYLSHLLLFKMLYKPYYNSFGNHFWFMSTIVQLYILFPLIYRIVNKNNAQYFLLISILISIVYSSVIDHFGIAHNPIIFRLFPQYLWIFVFGICYKLIKWSSWLILFDWKNCLLVLLVSFGAAFFINQKFGTCGDLYNDYFMFGGFVSGCRLLYLFVKNNKVIMQLVLWLESFSFSLYIFHMLTIEVFVTLFHIKMSLVFIPIFLTAALINAYIGDIIINRIKVLGCRFKTIPFIVLANNTAKG